MPATTHTEQTTAADTAATTDHDPSGPAAVADSPEPPRELSLDQMFDLLQNKRRRRVLKLLEEANEQLTLGELSECIAAEENDTTVASLTSVERKRVYVGLYQCHLPKLDDAGVIVYNADRGLVELDDNAAGLLDYLDATSAIERRWYRYYGGVSAGGVALLVASIVGLLPVAVVAGIILAVLFGCAGFHAIETHPRPDN